MVLYEFFYFFGTFVLITEPSAKCRRLRFPSSSIITTLDEYLMVSLGSSVAKVSNKKSLLTQRTSCIPLNQKKGNEINSSILQLKKERQIQTVLFNIILKFKKFQLFPILSS
jgi:hypothetical protein